MSIGEVCLLTNDVLKLSEFYRNILHISSNSESAVHQELQLDGTQLTIYNDGTLKNNINQNICLAFTVENVDTEFEFLQKMGAVVLEIPTTRPWGTRNLHFIDPDGNHVYFRSLI